MSYLKEELLTLHEHMGSRGTAYSSRTHGFTRNCLLFTNTWVHEERLTLHEHMGSRGTAYSSRTHGFTRNCLLFTNTRVHEELLTLHKHMGSRGTAYSSQTHGFTRNCLLFGFESSAPFSNLQIWARTQAVLVIGLYELLGNPTI